MKHSLFSWLNFKQVAPEKSEVSRLRFRYAEVIEPVHGGGLNQRGRIQFDGTSYYAVSAQGLPISRGTLVVLLSRSGNTWSVVPAPVADPADNLLNGFEEASLGYQQQYRTVPSSSKKFWLEVLLTCIVVVQAAGGSIIKDLDVPFHESPPVHDNWEI